MVGIREAVGKTGHRWVFGAVALLVFAGCGGGGESEKHGERASGKNHPPAVIKVRIQPGLAFSDRSLWASVTGSDPDGDPVEYAYAWRINGVVLGGEARRELGPANFKRGDEIVACVTPSDGKVPGQTVCSPPVVVQNAPPRVERVEIFPENPTRLDRLEARAVVEDPDGDDIAIHYVWIVNGERRQEGPSNTLSMADQKRGDRVRVTVVPEDPDSRGEPVSSVPVRIGNSPPRIVSQPPERLLAAGHYRYAVKAEDPDQDPLEFRLEGEVPEGMRIDPLTGVLDWRFAERPEAPVRVDIRASDGQGGEAEQRYELSLPAATPP